MCTALPCVDTLPCAPSTSVCACERAWTRSSDGAQVWSEAAGVCSVGADACIAPYYDGGCFARSWVEAFAHAGTQAVHAAAGGVSFGTQPDDDCNCTLSSEMFVEAIAHEMVTIYPKAVRTAEAETCVDGTLDSNAATACLFKATAELYAKVRRSACFCGAHSAQ